MQLTTSLHPLLTDRTIALLKQFSVTTVVQLLSMKPEKLCSILSLPFSSITEIRMNIFSEYSSFAVAGLEMYRACLDDEVHVQTGSSVLDKMVGRLQGGTVYEVFGYAGSGRTQLCLTAAAVTAGEGGKVVYVDTKGDFSPTRLAEIVSGRGGETMDMEKVMVVKIGTHKELLHAVTKVVNECEDVKLIVVDNVTSPIMSLVENNHTIRTAFTTGCKVGHLLHKVAREKGAVVIVVSNMKGGEKCNLPALGGIWGGLADVRLLMEQVSENKMKVRVVRGVETGAECDVTVNELGIYDCDLRT